MDISVIETDAWIGLNKLETLSLRNNKLTIIKVDIFANLPVLKFLSLAENGMSVIEPEALKSLQSLKYLILHNNKLGENPTEAMKPGIFYGLDSLTYLSLSAYRFDESGFKTVNPNVWSDINDTLTRLIMASNHFKTLLKNMFSHFTELTDLELHNNVQLQTIEPGAFRGLNSLSWLNLDTNFRVINYYQYPFILDHASPPTIPDNELTVHEDTLAELSNLKRISLSTVDLVPGTFRGLDSLHLLYLTDLPMTLNEEKFNAIDAAVWTDISGTLKSLDLSRNHFKTLTEDIFIHFPHLTDLTMYYNIISQINIKAFRGLSSLRDLRLGMNHITTLEVGVFKGLSSLMILRLHYNKIARLEPNVFQGLSSLQSLSLQSNELATLEWNVFNPRDFNGGHPGKEYTCNIFFI